MSETSYTWQEKTSMATKKEMSNWSEEIIEALGLPFDEFSTHELRCREIIRRCYVQFSPAFMASFCMIPSTHDGVDE
jgi:hypothetical protein